MNLATEPTSEDLEFLAARGIGAAEVLRQLACLREGVRPVSIDRPATARDGIGRIVPGLANRFVERCRSEASRRGLAVFVPASGAATRMFSSLRQLCEGTHADPASELHRLHELCALDLWRAVPDAPFDPDAFMRWIFAPPPLGAGLADRPKALLPFHVGPEAGTFRTALDEQIAEAAVMTGAGGRLDLHFTFSSEHLAEGLACAQKAAAREESLAGCRIHVEASVQDPATDTLSVTPEGALLRDSSARPLLRAGGHGALLNNLNRTPGQAVLVRNIDNIQPYHRHDKVLPWRMMLLGACLALRDAANDVLAGVPGADGSFRELLGQLGRPVCPTENLTDLATRPLRVAGMVPNQGDVGGGPYWVRDARGVSLQIVEQCEFDPGQRLAPSTHFNPVDMACAFCRPDGSPLPLEEFRDPGRAFRSNKNWRGRTLTTLEHPGLWNGSMAGWLSVFVEIPSEVFLPAKTIHDLTHPYRIPRETDPGRRMRSHRFTPPFGEPCHVD